MIRYFFTLFILLIFTEVLLSQDNTQINVSGKLTVEKLLNMVSEDSDYLFIYNEEEFDTSREIELNIINGTIRGLLKKILKGTELQYKIIGSQVVVFKPEQQLESYYLNGWVEDVSGNKLPGVNVRVENRGAYAVTDSDGNYKIEVKPDDKLIFSFTGLITEKIRINGREILGIRMRSHLSELKEVVVIGYGTQQKQEITGAITSLSGVRVGTKQAVNLSHALQGELSGVSVSRNGGDPASESMIHVRGITSIGSNSPLIIVDGVPVGNIDDINPQDVASVSVLKDASSASIYGARAAAGVILITTKRASKDKSDINYSFTISIDKPISTPQSVGVVRYMEMLNEQMWNDNDNGVNKFPAFSENFINNYIDKNRSEPDKYPITDWQGLVLKDYSVNRRHSLRFSTGSGLLKTQFSISYEDHQGLYNNKNYERINTRFNNDFNISKNMAGSLDVYFRNTKSKNPNVNPLPQIYEIAPVYPARWSDGTVAGGKSGFNPYAAINQGGFSRAVDNQVGGRFAVNYSAVKDLKISALFSPVLNTYKFKRFIKETPYYEYDNKDIVAGYIEGHKKSGLQELRNDNYKIVSQLLADYTKLIDNHAIDVMTGYEYYKEFYEFLAASGENFEQNDYPYLGVGNDLFKSNSGTAYENVYHSFFSRFLYNYSKKYFFQANIRRDGSSRFDKGYRWGNFPSFSAGWVVSREAFMKNTKPLSFLKLRASWGVLGNERINSYPYQSAVSFDNTLLYKGTDIVSATTSAQYEYSDSSITWETTSIFDVGFDLGLFSNRLYISADFYEKSSSDMLLHLEIPDYMGYDNPIRNTGKMSTTGWEIQTTWSDKVGDLNYSASFHISDSKSLMGDLGGTEFLGTQVKKDGSEFNEWYGYRSVGIYQNQSEVDNSAVMNSSVKPGDIKYMDISGPEGVPDGKISSEYDRVLLGGSLPRYIYGGNLYMKYKGFDFQLVFQGVGKQNVLMNERMIKPLRNAWGNIPEIYDDSYWSLYNSNEENRNADYPRLSEKSTVNNYAMSDFWLFDGSYLSIRSLTLGYSFTKDKINKLPLSEVQLFCTAGNLVTFSNYPDGWEPESLSLNYPVVRTFTFGVKLKY